MKIEANNAAALYAIIKSDIAAIRRMDVHLEQIGIVSEGASFKDLAATAYILHNMYNAFENSFEHLSREFENNVKDVSQWHKELLAKMFLEMPEIRPAVFPMSCRKILNDLRGFRHVFRHSYDFDLDAPRLRLLVDGWIREKEMLLQSLDEFCKLLRVSALR